MIKTCCSVKLNVDQNLYKVGLKALTLSGFIQERTGNEGGWRKISDNNSKIKVCKHWEEVWEKITSNHAFLTRQHRERKSGTYGTYPQGLFIIELNINLNRRQGEDPSLAAETSYHFYFLTFFFHSLRETSLLAPEFLLFFHRLYLWKWKNFPYLQRTSFMWQKVGSSFYSFQYFMRNLAGLRDSLSFRSEREATQRYALVPRENVLFLVQFLSQPLESSNLFTFLHQYQLELSAAIDTITGLKAIKELKHLWKDLSGIALPEPKLVIQKPAVKTLPTLIMCLLVPLWSSRDT